MTRSPRHVAAHPGTRACVHVAFVLLVVLGIAAGGAGTAAAVGATRPAQLVADSEFLPQDSDGTGDAPATSLPEPTAEICEGPGPSATVVAADGTASDAGPVYRPGSPIRVTGGGWCIGGRPAQGEQVLRARLVAVGGYVSHEKTTQTVVFADGAFDTTIRIADLYAHLPRGAEVPSGCLVLLVTGLDLRSAVAAEALAARARPAEGGSVALAVRLVGEDVTTDDLEIMARAPVVARIPHDRAVAQRVARGDDPTRGRGSTRRAARAVASGLLEADRPW